MCSVGSPGLYSVPPSEKCRKFARQLKFLLIIEFITLIVLFVLVPTGGTVWVLLQVFSIILAYISVKDANAYRPPILQMYIFISAIGTLFCTVYFAVSLSIANTAMSTAACTLFAVNAIVLAACTRVSWQLFKELMLSSPLITGTTGAYIFGGHNSGVGVPGRSGNVNGPIEMANSNRANSNMNNSGLNSASVGFVPFGGEGYKLSGGKSIVESTDQSTCTTLNTSGNKGEIKSLV
ncbi:hypothetical protein FG379_001696 [Cryptosporidium bovis]|uniref:uncharacterized protein n=1 Tax=Cryptosporidium bovis TaxID=310047 RepID=UPI00351A7EA7|nr:hypothetical protein FG379_001696 [Cryptosporidium bovis]